MEGGNHPTILVVEDETELVETFARWLRPEYKVITTRSADEALTEINDDIDVVLLDRRLPDRPGGEVLREIRDRGYDCRIAMITAVDPDIDILDMDFDDYIVKPVPKEELTNIVNRLLRLAEYDVRVKRSYGLASKLAVLEAEKSGQELEKSEEYQAKRKELLSINEDILDLLSEFDSGSFEVAYRDL